VPVVAASVRDEALALNKNLPAPEIHTMDAILSDVVSQPRFQTILLTLFGTIALLLSAVGVYGVMSYSVAQRTHEIGIRMALGAGPRQVLSNVVGRGMTLVGIGLVIGLAAALALTRLMSGLLFGVSSTDPLTFLGISVLLTGVALGACLVPARRAIKVDPLIALRHE
jgi:putative ABC transport system permease protein